MQAVSLDDHALLERFARHRAHEDFAQLVERHAQWIFASAYRQLRDPHLAEDATQAVFILLAQRASTMGSERKISGWLFRALHFTVKNMRRAEHRRRIHEDSVAAAAPVVAGPDDESRTLELAQNLDAAVAHLGADDRTAILLRFYQSQEFNEIARALNTTEAAARKRVERAVHKLRASLGPALSASSLSAAVIVGINHSPPALTATIAHAATGGLHVSASAAAAAKGAGILMATAKVKTVIVIAVACLAVVIPATVVVITMHGNNETLSPAPAATAIADETPAAPQIRFKDFYALPKGAAIAQVLPPYPNSRLEFYRQSNRSQAEAIPEGPDGMIIQWKDGYPTLWGMTFRGRTGRTYSVSDLAENYLNVSRVEIEGEKEIIDYRFHGDFVVNADATKEEYRASLEKLISDELGYTVKLTFRDVERPITVLKGTWNYKHAEGAPESSPERPQVEFYGEQLGPSNGGGGGSSNINQLGKPLSGWIKRPVTIEATGAPDQIQYHYNYPEPLPGERRVDPSRNADLVIKHLEEQTGLKAGEETRTVTRLFVERTN